MEIKNPLFTPPTKESLDFERATVNNKRFITKVGMGKADSSYGQKDIFTFTQGIALENQSIFNILKIAKKSLINFNDKFDWTRTDTASGYTPDGTPSVNKENVIPESNVGQTTGATTQQAPPEKKAEPTFNFEEINF